MLPTPYLEMQVVTKKQKQKQTHFSHLVDTGISPD